MGKTLECDHCNLVLSLIYCKSMKLLSDFHVLTHTSPQADIKTAKNIQDSHSEEENSVRRKLMPHIFIFCWELRVI